MQWPKPSFTISGENTGSISARPQLTASRKRPPGSGSLSGPPTRGASGWAPSLQPWTDWRGCVARAPRLPRCLAPGGPHGRGLGRRQRRPAIRVPLEGALEVSKGCNRIQKSPTKYNGFWISLYKSFAEPSNKPVVLDEELACTKLAIAFADSEAWIAALVFASTGSWLPQTNWFMIASNCCWLGPCIGGTWYAPSVPSIFTNRQCRRVPIWAPWCQTLKARNAEGCYGSKQRSETTQARRLGRAKGETSQAWMGFGSCPGLADQRNAKLRYHATVALFWALEFSGSVIDLCMHMPCICSTANTHELSAYLMLGITLYIFTYSNLRLIACYYSGAV